MHVAPVPRGELPQPRGHLWKEAEPCLGREQQQFGEHERARCEPKGSGCGSAELGVRREEAEEEEAAAPGQGCSEGCKWAGMRPLRPGRLTDATGVGGSVQSWNLVHFFWTKCVAPCAEVVTGLVCGSDRFFILCFRSHKHAKRLLWNAQIPLLAHRKNLVFLKSPLAENAHFCARLWLENVSFCVPVAADGSAPV